MAKDTLGREIQVGNMIAYARSGVGIGTVLEVGVVLDPNLNDKCKIIRKDSYGYLMVSKVTSSKTVIIETDKKTLEEIINHEDIKEEYRNTLLQITKM